ncbi:uncharacterized protein DSM5745_09072 [Aspergillus mulundensis]|uniref:Cytochrome P450 n=1 Tax=Aspergillus mulundensis TaxID=1810919 RepID=A0A3D8QZH3_9EURO|nr:hypothetical protein DSM5745_09072 [Aspergillus mulundensis]RDW67206.1 hypothetical protein DSM5745_09072 [Aspergillus mulundensis]
MPKSNWYIAFEAHGKGPKKENIFSTRDNHWHARYRGLVEQGFSMEQLLHREEAIDALLLDLLAKLDASCAPADGKAAASHTPSPSLIDQLHYFVFDVGGILAFSRPYGFVKGQSDLEGIIRLSRKLSTHLTRLAQAPVFQYLLDKNPLVRFFGLVPPPVTFARRYLPLTRISHQIDDPRSQDEKPKPNEDLLDSWIEAHLKHPDVVTRNEIIDLALMLISPTPDAVYVHPLSLSHSLTLSPDLLTRTMLPTSRTTLGVLIYYLFKSPNALSKLRAELDSSLPNTTIPPYTLLSNPTHLPYLTACILESLRIHPPPGFMIERVVPPGGAVVDGQYMPPGTLVSVSPWVIHHNEEIFGVEPDVFRPERWVEAEPEQRKKMEGMLCAFGFGGRVCLGKDVALLELYKVVAVLVKEYEMTLADVEKDMTITWGNMVCVDMEVRIATRRRESTMPT